MPYFYFGTKCVFICMQLLRLHMSLGEGQCRISVPNVFYLYAITEVTQESR